MQGCALHRSANISAQRATYPLTVITLSGIVKVTGHATLRFAMMTMYCRQDTVSNRGCDMSCVYTRCEQLPGL